MASGNSVSFLELFEVLKKVTGYTGEIQWISNKNAKQYQDSVVVCIEKSRELLGYEPEYNLEKGIQEYYEWKKNKNQA